MRHHIPLWNVKENRDYRNWIRRRKGRIPRTEYKTCDEVLNRLNLTQETMKNIKTRHLKYFGHLQRHNKAKENILERKAEKKSKRTATTKMGGQNKEMDHT